MKTEMKLQKALIVFYVVASLTAMAPMNLGFLFLLAIASVFFFQQRSVPEVGKDSLSLSAFSGGRAYRFWAIALWIACWGSLLVTSVFPLAYAGHDPEVTFHGFLKIWYLLIPGVLLFLFRSIHQTEKNFDLAFWIRPWWVGTLILCLVAIVQFFTGWPHPQLIPDQTQFFHATLFFGHHLSTASILIFPAFTALAVALGMATRGSTGPQPLSARFAWCVGIAGVLILFLSYARTAWLAILLGFALLIKKYFLPFFSRKQWVMALVVGLIGFGALVQIPMVKNRMEKLYGVSERVELWKANIDFFVHRPLTGIGWLKTQEMSEFYFKSIDPENYKHRFWGHAHSNFFEMLGGTGLIGLLAFLGWSFFTLRFAHRISRERHSSGDHLYGDFAFGIFIALLLLHFNGLTNVTFWEGKVMHQQMLAIGMLLILERRT